MFLFSKKFLSLLVVMTLAIGEERHLAEGLFKLERCVECDSNNGTSCPLGNTLKVVSCPDTGACALKKDGDNISKYCEVRASKWSDNGKVDGKPKCIKNDECYCNDEDNCNNDINFGLETLKAGSVGTKVISHAMLVLSMMVAAWMYYISSN